MLRALTPRELMRLHVEALFTHDGTGRLLRVNVPGGADAPRFFLGLTAEGPVMRFRHDVDEVTMRELRAAVADSSSGPVPDGPLNPSRYEEILAQSVPIENTWLGPAFSFPNALPETADTILVTSTNAHVLDPLLRDWMPDVETGQPMCALVLEGRAVAVCCSVRLTNGAHEAGVETVPAFRGRGFAAPVVSSWARAVRDRGKVPLYSTSWQNQSSRAVARKLRLLQFGSDMHIR
jgi:hypothetical protein